MTFRRLPPTVLLALFAGLASSCGEPAGGIGDGGARGQLSATATTDPPEIDRPRDTESGTDDADRALLDTLISGEELERLSGGGVRAGSARGAPDPEVHFPVEGPRGGALFPLAEEHGYYEVAHSEHWGVAALYLYDAGMAPRSFDVPPVLNIRCDGESLALEPSRESFEGRVDGGWHFEDDALLGIPETGRFRLAIDGRTWTPPFAHVHLGTAHAHASEHATGPHVHGPGPHGGHVLTLGAHRAHVEVVHRPHWGVLGLYVYDAAMKPRALDEMPVLNILCDQEPLQLVPGRESWDGEEDGGWHFEDDALLGETGPARFRLVVGGRVYAPPFLYHAHGEEPGHTHDAVAD